MDGPDFFFPVAVVPVYHDRPFDASRLSPDRRLIPAKTAAPGF
jgi:hypothetical protein